ncbi:MAG: cupin domain-containing protein [Woeseiaceae bacterium]
MKRLPLLPLALCLVVACAGNPKPKLPYPAFQQADELPDIFMASLPGVRAKPLAGDLKTRTSSNRVDFPEAWQGTTGGSPGKATEIFVLAGEISLSGFVLKPGGYAYVPPGSLGFQIEVDRGARVLYFSDDIDDAALIQSPIILESQVLEWQAVAPGIERKVLRHDPGTGAHTWMLRISPGAKQSWSASTVVREGYMLSGQYQHAECFNGEALTWQYAPGGYFLRPPEMYNGGPEAVATTRTIWFMREQEGGEELTIPNCAIVPTVQDSDTEEPEDQNQSLFD